MDGVNVDEENVRDVDPDFEPWSRPRSCTWPKISTVKQEGEDVAGTPPGIVLSLDPVQGKVADPEGGVTVWVGGATTRKGCSRRNAWGSHSYAELISQAIESSPEKRLTLAQIYDWMVNTVPYFRDKGDSNSSAGWKNSVRHNLSLHSKFLRVQNEATGKSSWWTLNPEASRSAKETRHRHSMDNSSRLLKSRTQARQAKQARAAVLAGSGVSTQGKGGPEGPKADGSSQSLPGSSPLSGSRLDDVDVWTGFRSRTDSNASTLSGRRSPIAPPQEEEEDGPKEVVRSGLTASTEMSMAELDLSGKLTLMAGQQRAVNLRGCPPAPPTHLRFSPLQSLQPAAPSSQATSRWPGSGCQFQSPPFDQGVSYGTHLVHSLEALLTANGPQLSDIGVAQGVSGVPATCSQPLEKVGLEKRNLMSVTPAGPSHSTARLSLETLHSLAGQGEGLLPETGLHCFSTLVGHNNLSASQEQLPTDLDADMFTENLACDIDYIINSDLLDGDAVDFSFDMIAPVNQGCHGNIQDWVPS